MQVSSGVCSFWFQNLTDDFWNFKAVQHAQDIAFDGLSPQDSDVVADRLFRPLSQNHDTKKLMRSLEFHEAEYMPKYMIRSVMSASVASSSQIAAF